MDTFVVVLDLLLVQEVPGCTRVRGTIGGETRGPLVISEDSDILST